MAAKGQRGFSIKGLNVQFPKGPMAATGAASP
jgi:hypothetical protein